jgi:hypothetical protein
MVGWVGGLVGSTDTWVDGRLDGWMDMHDLSTKCIRFISSKTL